MKFQPRYWTALALGALISSSACAINEHRRYQEAETALRECLVENADDPDRCEPLRATRDAEYQRYERTAEQAWGCKNTPEGCQNIP